MMLALEKNINVPLNLGSGKGVTIREIVNEIVRNLPDNRKIVWDKNKPSGDALRLMDTQRAKELIDFESEIGIKAGIKETMDWYLTNRENILNRYNVFTDEDTSKGLF